MVGTFRQLGASPRAYRVKEAHLIVLDPILPRQNVAEARAADAFHFTALHRQELGYERLVASHDLEMGAGGTIERPGHDRGRARCATGADNELSLPGVRHRVIGSAFPGDADKGHRLQVSDPGVFLRFVRSSRVQELVENDRRLRSAEGRAVARRHVVDVGGRAHARCARHVLRHERRIAWDVASQITRHEPAAEVIHAGLPRADDEAQGLAAIEVRDRVRASLRYTEQRRERAKKRECCERFFSVHRYSASVTIFQFVGWVERSEAQHPLTRLQRRRVSLRSIHPSGESHTFESGRSADEWP